MSGITTASVWIAGLAIISLIAAGWRKPARATTDPTRDGRRSRGLPGVELTEADAFLHQRTGLWRKVWAVVASSGLAIVGGAIIATVLSFGVAFTVIRLTDMLRQ